MLPKVLLVTYIQIFFGDVHSEPRPRPYHAQGSIMPKAKPRSMATPLSMATSRSMTKQAAFTQAAFAQAKSPTLNLGQAPTVWLATPSTRRASQRWFEHFHITVTDNNNEVFSKIKCTFLPSFSSAQINSHQHRLERFTDDLARR